jgi:hypothetical protein
MSDGECLIQVALAVKRSLTASHFPGVFSFAFLPSETPFSADGVWVSQLYFEQPASNAKYYYPHDMAQQVGSWLNCELLRLAPLSDACSYLLSSLSVLLEHWWLLCCKQRVSRRSVRPSLPAATNLFLTNLFCDATVLRIRTFLGFCCCESRLLLTLFLLNQALNGLTQTTLTRTRAPLTRATIMLPSSLPAAVRPSRISSASLLLNI